MKQDCTPPLSTCPELPPGFKWGVFSGEPCVVRAKDGAVLAWITSEREDSYVASYPTVPQSYTESGWVDIKDFATAEEALAVLASHYWLGLAHG